MLSVLRRAVAVASLVAVSASVAQAQLKVEEIRVDVAQLGLAGGTTALGVGIPGTVALGIYLNDKIALEPTVGLGYFKPDGGDGVTAITVGVFAPYYLAGDRGRNGLFIAPGVVVSKVTDVDAAIDFGADIGFKKAMANNRVSMSVAGTFRGGDSFDPDSEIGARFGFSVFWR
jgi:hypothetical protein